MEVLLINPFHETHIHSFSWGVLANASYLKSKHNLEVEILDGSYYFNNRKTFFNELEEYLKEVKLVGFTCFSTDVYEVKNLIDFIKSKNKDIKIVVGGPHAVLLPEQTCKYENIDFVCYGDGEVALAELIHKINSNDTDYSDVKGILYKEDGKVIKTPPARTAEFFPIDYEMLPDKKKKTYGKYMQVLTGRGCSFKCTFCYNAIIGQKWFPRDIVNMVDEIEELVNKYGTKQIYFRDENFFQSKDRILQFIELYRQRGFSFKWRATIRANYFNDNYITPELLKELESINCEEMKFGLESASERVLKYLRKGIKIDKVKNMIVNLSKVKITGNYSFLIGIPTETFEEYKETIRLIKFIKDTDPTANVIGPQYYRVYPGGELYNDVITNYEFVQPNSFEEWADAVVNDNLGLNKEMDYPWIDKRYEDLAKYADTMMLLYGKTFQELVTWKKIAVLPFVILEKLRVNKEYYKYMYDMKLFAFIFEKLHMYYK